MFPLDGVLLCPGLLLPLHVFEPRYRVLLEHALDGEGLIAMTHPTVGHSVQDEFDPPVHEICGLGKLVEHESLPDGRANILLRGETRLRILEELPKIKEFRMIRTEEVPDVLPSRDLTDELAELHDSLNRLGVGGLHDLQELPPQQFVDSVLVGLPLSPEIKLELFSEPLVDARLRRLIDNLPGRNTPDIDIEPGDPRLN